MMINGPSTGIIPLKYDDDILDIDFQMRQYLLVVEYPLQFYTFSIVLFHKYGGANVAITN